MKAYVKLRTRAAQCCFSLVPQKVHTLVSFDYPITGRVLSEFEVFILEVLVKGIGIKQFTNVRYGSLEATTKNNAFFWPWTDDGMSRASKLASVCTAIESVIRSTPRQGSAAPRQGSAALRKECASLRRAIPKLSHSTILHLETAYVSNKYKNNLPAPAQLSIQALRESWEEISPDTSDRCVSQVL